METCLFSQTTNDVNDVYVKYYSHQLKMCTNQSHKEKQEQNQTLKNSIYTDGKRNKNINYRFRPKIWFRMPRSWRVCWTNFDHIKIHSCYHFSSVLLWYFHSIYYCCFHWRYFFFSLYLPEQTSNGINLVFINITLCAHDFYILWCEVSTYLITIRKKKWRRLCLHVRMSTYLFIIVVWPDWHFEFYVFSWNDFFFIINKSSSGVCYLFIIKKNDN